MKTTHYSNYDGINEAIVGFNDYCRTRSNLGIGINHTKEALLAANQGFINDKQSFKYSLRSLYCTCKEEYPAFDKLFDIYWRKKKHSYSPTTSKNGNSNITKKSKGSVVMMGFGDTKDDEDQKEDAKNVTGANRMEALRKTDFSKVATIDNDVLDELVEKLLQQMNHRLKRRLRTSKDGKIDLRKTIRKNLSHGDDFIHLIKKNRKLEKYRLNVLLDVSGSMDKYSFYLLKFIWLLKANFKQIEAFIFSTKLIRITDYVDQAEVSMAMMQMSQHADNWSSGTKIGECLLDFNEQYGKRVLNGKSITIILSDGLDTGSPEVLARETQRIKLRTNKLVWLNPLKGMEGYQPLAKGMKAALPQVDTFKSAHNLDSLLELENILAHV
ncbi:MAG: VWA domain-containing protein [Cyclobacteriaceae bacterium]